MYYVIFSTLGEISSEIIEEILNGNVNKPRRNIWINPSKNL